MSELKPVYCSQCGKKLLNGKCDHDLQVNEKDYPLTEAAKVEIFDKLWQMCYNHMQGTLHPKREMDCRGECDCARYIFEYAMQQCLRTDIFKMLAKYESKSLEEEHS